MSYTPTSWKSGDVVTSAKLNKIEKGIEDAGIIIVLQESVSNGTYTLDKTIQEIYDAIGNGSLCIIPRENEEEFQKATDIVSIVTIDDEYTTYSLITSLNYHYTASSAEGYPSRSEGSSS